MFFHGFCALLHSGFAAFAQVAKHVEACKAQVVFLAESCNEATYKKLIQAG